MKIMDKLGIDTHLIRYLELAIFDQRPQKNLIYNFEILKDLFLLIFGIFPFFIIGLRFWTAPVYLNYNLKINSFIVPIILIVIFAASHIDIIFLGFLVLIMNFYVFWYHSDPPTYINENSKEYSSAN
jgi:hypothetical protein